jgi:leucyl aminopeptidase
VDICDRLGASHIRIFGGDVPKNSTEDQAAGWVAEILKRAADYAGSRGVFLGLENHGGITLQAKRIVSIIPATENLPSGKALKPGDIIRMYSGKTVEVLNTDAEGRLILADALAYAKKFKPNAIIDLATLTGACVVALGNEAAGILGNDAKLVADVKKAGEASGERVWELPLWREYIELIRSEVADIKNAGGREAGTIQGAAFLKQFVEKIPWAHLDIAGVAWTEKEKDYLCKGATGTGIRLLSQLFIDWAGE